MAITYHYSTKAMCEIMCMLLTTPLGFSREMSINNHVYIDSHMHRIKAIILTFTLTAS